MSAPADAGPVWLQLVPFLAIFAIFYFIVLQPMKRRQRRIADFQSGLKVGDRIVTTGGIYGQIAKLSDRTVQLQVAEKVRIEVARSAIGGHQGQEPVVTESSGA
jgi:preprotein translocase subunit YajC